MTQSLLTLSIISLQGDFVGRAAVVELLKQRPKRMLVQLKVDSEEVDPHVSTEAGLMTALYIFFM